MWPRVRGGEGPRSGRVLCPLPELENSGVGGGVDITVVIAQEVGSGKSERRREGVVANIGTISKEL